MKKQTFTILLFILSFNFVFGQYTNLRWVNRYAEIDFSQYPVKYTERRDDRFGNQLNYTLTDCKGDIVFSVGITGYFLNRNLDTIPGGGLLYGNSRSSVLNGVQFPNSKDSIFVVHTNYLDKKHSTYWSLVKGIGVNHKYRIL